MSTNSNHLGIPAFFGDPKAALQIDEIVADPSECGVVLSGVAASPGVLAQEIDLGGERPEVIVRPDMELDGFLVSHAFSMQGGH